MSARLWELWRQWSGVAMAERTAYTKGYDAGFTEGLITAKEGTEYASYMRGFIDGLQRMGNSERGVAFMDGFIEGRESTRTIPLDSSFADEEETSWPSH